MFSPPGALAKLMNVSVVVMSNSHDDNIMSDMGVKLKVSLQFDRPTLKDKF